MSSPSLMEWNTKHPLHWDWENLIMFNGTAENGRKVQPADWDIDEERGIDAGDFLSSKSVGSRSVSGGSGTGFGLASLSKGLKSASINSSSSGEVRTSKFTLETYEATPEDSGDKTDFVKAKLSSSSPTLEPSVGSGEPPLGLKLGKRTYFEDVCGGSNAKTSSLSVIPTSSVNATKRSKSSSQGMQVPRCQVEGCNLDLSSAKDYHRKHRVCESHSKCPKVIVAGVERRFCQQCSRFHSLAEFDEKKRSCRRRLSDHNARRRKPQPESIQLNPARLSSSPYDGTQQMSLVWNRASLSHPQPNASLTWGSTSSPKFTITKELTLRPSKLEGINGPLRLPGNELTSYIPMHQRDSRDSDGLLLSRAKNNGAEVLNQGLEETIISSNADGTQDLHRALSLLSTNSWSSCEPKSFSVGQSMDAHHTSMPQSVLRVMPQGLPLPLASSSDCWRVEQQSTDCSVPSLTSHSGGYFQEFQLLRGGPNDSDFSDFSGQLN